MIWMQCKIFDTHPWGASSGWSTGCSDGGLKHSAGQVAKVQASPPISGIIPLHIHINYTGFLVLDDVASV